MSMSFGDGEAKINLLSADGSPELVWADRRNRNELRRATKIVTERQDELLEKWNEIHD